MRNLFCAAVAGALVLGATFLTPAKSEAQTTVYSGDGTVQYQYSTPVVVQPAPVVVAPATTYVYPAPTYYYAAPRYYSGYSYGPGVSFSFGYGRPYYGHYYHGGHYHGGYSHGGHYHGGHHR